MTRDGAAPKKASGGQDVEEEKQGQEEEARKQEAGGKLQEARGKSKTWKQARAEQDTVASKRWKKNVLCKNKKAARKKLESTTHSKFQEAFRCDEGNVLESQRPFPAFNGVLFWCCDTSLFWGQTATIWS